MLNLKKRSVKDYFFEVCNLKKSSDYDIQFLRSVVVSVVALVFDFSTLVGLKQGLGVHYLLAATIAFLLGVAVNYLLSSYWVFAERKVEKRHHEVVIFVVICAIGLLFNLVIIYLLVEILNVDYRAAKLFATVVVFFWNFLARKKFLY